VSVSSGDTKIEVRSEVTKLISNPAKRKEDAEGERDWWAWSIEEEPDETRIKFDM
jgi:hypothetical protein